MYEGSVELTVIQNTICWLGILGKVWQELKKAAQYFDGYRFNLGKLNELEVRKNYQIEIKNTFAALGIFGDSEDINRAWRNIKENIKTSAKRSLGLRELKQLNPWFDEGCLHFLDGRKPAKNQWVQDPSQSNVDYLNNLRRETSRHFRIKKRHI